MPVHHQHSSLSRSLAAVAELGIVPGIAPALEASTGDAMLGLRDSILAEIPAFEQSGNPDIMQELAEHVREHVEELMRLLSGGTVSDFEFVKSHARRRAETRFPLEASLHAYRCGHKVLSRWMRDAAIATAPDKSQQAISAIADFSIEYTDAISTVVAAEYVSQTRLLAESDVDQRTELLRILLHGYDEADGRVARILRRAGYLAQRQSYCVVLARSPDAAEMENPMRAQRMLEHVSRAIDQLPVRVLSGVRDNMVVTVVSTTRRMSGWTAPRTTLSNLLREPLLKIGPAALIGVSTDQPSTAHIPKAFNEARMALDLASVSERVVSMGELPLRRLLVHFASADLQSALPAWTKSFVTANEKSRGALVKTLQAYANADMNVLRAARELGVHSNTIYTRLTRIEDVTGLDAQRFDALNELLLAVECVGA